MEMLNAMLAPIVGAFAAIALILALTVAVTAFRPSPAWHLTGNCANWIETESAAFLNQGSAQ